MNAFYFGTSQRALFGVYHPPVSRQTRNSGVVLCYPFGHEYMRAHRPFRQLATQLSRAGFHVLRFDYYGTGDSAGASNAGDITQWLHDTSTAIVELKETAAVSTVSLVGLRLGATLAAQLAAGRRDLTSVVLWNPVVNGKAYVGELTGNRDAAQSAFLTEAKQVPVVRDTLGVQGFPLTPKMRADFEGIDLLALEGLRDTEVFLVASEERAEYLRLGEHLRKRNPRSAYNYVPTARTWSEVDEFVSALLPQKILQAIVGCLTRSFDG